MLLIYWVDMIVVLKLSFKVIQPNGFLGTPVHFLMNTIIGNTL